MTETGRRMKELLDKQVIPSITQRSECLADWYKMAQTVYLQTQILDKDMDNYERVLESFSLRLSQESKERYDHICRALDSWLPTVSKQFKSATKPQNDVDEERRRRQSVAEENKWKDICSTQEQILLILYKNNSLVNELAKCVEDKISNCDEEDSASNVGNLQD